MSNTKLHVPNALDAHLQTVVLTFGIAGIVPTALLLFTIAYAAWNPASRHHLNRVSFRLLVCALISNLIFAATSIPVFSRQSPGCSFMAFFGLSILMFSACMFFCIALNLQLVLVHHINGNLMEKFYYIGSVALVAILNITPYAAGQFGLSGTTCWFNNPRPDVQFRWLVGSQSVWMLLMSTGEVVSFCLILGYMHRTRIRRQNALTSSFSTIAKPPIVAYRNIILRIGLYPLLSCCLNFTGSILDIWLTKNPVPTELQWRLSFVDLCVFGLRPALYTILAAADPGFLRAIHVLRNQSKSTHSESTRPTSRIEFTNSHSMEQFSINRHTLVRLEQERSTGEPEGSNKSRLEQSSASLTPFEERSTGSRGAGARWKPPFMEQEPEQSGSSQAEPETVPAALSAEAMRVLPSSARQAATEAYRRDAHPLTLERAFKYLDDETPPRRAIGLLPVCFVHLDAAVPSPELLTQMTAATLKTISRAAISLTALFQIALGDVPDGALTYLLPRVFAWYTLVLEQWHHFHGDDLESKVGFRIDFLDFICAFDQVDEAMKVALSLPGFLEHIVQLWTVYPTVDDPEEADEMLRLLGIVTLEVNSSTPEVSGKLTAGAGGSIKDLARVINTSLTAVLDRGDTITGPADALSLMDAIRALALIVVDVDDASGNPPPDPPWLGYRLGDLSHELMYHDIIPVLMRAANFIIGPALELYKEVRLNLTLAQMCLFILIRIISNTHGDSCGWIEDALEHGLVRFVLRCGKLMDGVAITGGIGKLHDTLKKLLTHLLPIELINRTTAELLVDLEDTQIEGYKTDSEIFRTSLLYPSWQTFEQAVRERTALLRKIGSAPVDYKACDSSEVTLSGSPLLCLYRQLMLQCLDICEGSTMQRCSGCQSTYYCSKECQRADWRRIDGHREHCVFYRIGSLCLTSRMRERFPHPQRVYMRAVLHHDYQQHWIAVYITQIRLMLKNPATFGLDNALSSQPTPPIITLFNYTRHPLRILAFSTADESEDSIASACAEEGAEWGDLVTRARSSPGQFHLHVMYLFDGDDVRYVIVPLRCDDAGRALDSALKEVARRMFRESGSSVDEGTIRGEVERLRAEFSGMKQIY
ncbi:hypothetical protein C8F01DRAFT_1302731 [Mycena amicta]|nr:hypothetical protein C8F01DRAFT_1302731 [Mycena amicta]